MRSTRLGFGPEGMAVNVGQAFQPVGSGDFRVARFFCSHSYSYSYSYSPSSGKLSESKSMSESREHRAGKPGEPAGWKAYPTVATRLKSRRRLPSGTRRRRALSRLLPIGHPRLVFDRDDILAVAHELVVNRRSRRSLYIAEFTDESLKLVGS